MSEYSVLFSGCFMSDSDEFEYESDDDPYGGAEEEA